MKINTILRIILSWLPSVIIIAFFLPNAIEKIFQSDQMEKIVTNKGIIIIVGIILLLAVVLFLIKKTIILGTTILSLYMTFVVFVHMFNGKPSEVAILIVMCTIFAAYLREPNLFHIKKQ